MLGISYNGQVPSAAEIQPRQYRTSSGDALMGNPVVHIITLESTRPMWTFIVHLFSSLSSHSASSQLRAGRGGAERVGVKREAVRDEAAAASRGPSSLSTECLQRTATLQRSSALPVGRSKGEGTNPSCIACPCQDTRTRKHSNR